MTRLRHDLNFVSSAGLILSGLTTGITGIVADLWDLNDFWYHTVSGYVMGGFAVLHVALNWGRMVAYAKFRLRSVSVRSAANAPARPAGAAVRPTMTGPPGETEPVKPLHLLTRATLSRRGLLGLAVGGVGGLVLGRGLRPPPPIPAGSDVGVIYHQWSKPGVIDALGSVANWGQPVDLYKAYPGARVVALPEPRLEDGLPSARAIATRPFDAVVFGPTDEPRRAVPFPVPDQREFGNARRTAPSSGALYPIEVNPIVHNVDAVERGVYHYAYREHALELVRGEEHAQPGSSIRDWARSSSASAARSCS